MFSLERKKIDFLVDIEMFISHLFTLIFILTFLYKTFKILQRILDIVMTYSQDLSVKNITSRENYEKL